MAKKSVPQNKLKKNLPTHKPAKSKIYFKIKYLIRCTNAKLIQIKVYKQNFYSNISIININ